MKKSLPLILVFIFLTTISSSQNLDMPSKKISFEEQMKMGKYLNDIKKKIKFRYLHNSSKLFR